jgi:hypothetical protein
VTFPESTPPEAWHEPPDGDPWEKNTEAAPAAAIVQDASAPVVGPVVQLLSEYRVTVAVHVRPLVAHWQLVHWRASLIVVFTIVWVKPAGHAAVACW